jgi:hypothetical protein
MLSKKAINTFSHLRSRLVRKGESKYGSIIIVLKKACDAQCQDLGFPRARASKYKQWPSWPLNGVALVCV